MKKFLYLAFIFFEALVISSCSFFNVKVNIDIDFRNKDARSVDYSGRSVDFARAADDGFHEPVIVTKPLDYQLYESDYNGIELTPDEIDQMFTFNPQEDGIHITYRRPEKLKDHAIELFQLLYYDNNENSSTMQILNDDFCNEYIDAGYDENGDSIYGIVGKENLEWIYPLCIENSRMKFQVQINYIEDSEGPVSKFNEYYEVYAKGGKGIIDDLPKQWNSSPYITVKKSSIKINHIIPVSGSNRRKSIMCFSTDQAPGTGWERWNNSEFAFELISTDEDSDKFTVDLTHVLKNDVEYCTSEDFRSWITKPNIFVNFRYAYTLDDYPYCEFRTPPIESAVIRSPF